MLRNRRLISVVAMVSAIVAGLVLPSTGSSHREAPQISEDPVADATDVYAFVAPDAPDRLTIIANYIPLEEPAGGPNFAKFGDDVRYLVNIDNNGDAVPDVVYEIRFTTSIRNPNTFLYNTGQITSLTDPDWNIRQTYTVTRLAAGRRVEVAKGLATPPVNIGPRSTPNYESLAAAAVHTIGQTKLFAGQRDDPFFVDLGSIFDLGGLRPFNQAHVLKEPTTPGVDGVGGFNTHSIAIQVPIASLTRNKSRPTNKDDPAAVLGFWTTAQRREFKTYLTGGRSPSTSGRWINVSRLGMPLVNEVVIPLGAKNKWNASGPIGDAEFLSYVRDPELGRLIPILYPGVNTPPAPRNDLIAIFLTGISGINKPPGVRPAEMLRLNVAIAPVAFNAENRLGVIGGDNAGFPNGRRLGDDVTDVAIRAMAGGTPLTPTFNIAPNNQLGDGVDGNDLPFLTTFPYVGTPHQGYDHTHHRVGP